MADEKNPYESDYSPSPTTATPKKAKKKEPLPQVDFDVKKTYGTPSALLDNLEKVESAGEATALHPNSKALGAYQFIPETAKHLHDIGVKFNPFDRDESRAAADYYLSSLAAQNKGDWNKAIAAYGGFVKEDPSAYVASVAKGVNLGSTPAAAASSAPTTVVDNPYAGDYGNLVVNAQAAARVKRQGANQKEAPEFSLPQSPVNLFGSTSVVSPTVNSARTAAEMLTGAPAGSVAALTPAVKTTGSSGYNWLTNWADINKPDFEGGVPEAAQTYNRTKPGGKVTSKLFKKFGNRSLNIHGQGVENAAAEEAANLAAQAETNTARAATLSGPLSLLGKVLYGGGAALGAYDTGRRALSGDTTGAAISGAGTLAQMAAPYVSAVTGAGAGALGATALPAIATAAPLYNMARDRIEYLKRHPEEQQVVTDQYDAMGNPLY